MAVHLFKQSLPINKKKNKLRIFRYLATGESMRSLAFQFRVSHQYISVIIKDTLKAIKTRFFAEAMPEPTTEKLKQNAEKFFERWNYPNCVSAIDGKHVRIFCPKNSGSCFFNYKDYFSVVVLAMVDAEYKFVAVDVGAYGREGDSGIFQRSSFGRKIYNEEFNFPPPIELPQTKIILPHVIIADKAFALHQNVMRSYPSKQALTNRQKSVYNYRHSRARRTSENAFGIMSSYFRIFYTPIMAKAKTVDSIIIVACILHNFMRDEKILSPQETRFNDVENINCPTNNLIGLAADRTRHSQTAYNIREQFKKYFNGVGRVTWQDEYLCAH